jgi:hypothetical protein
MHRLFVPHMHGAERNATAARPGARDHGACSPILEAQHNNRANNAKRPEDAEEPEQEAAKKTKQ